MGKGMWGGDCGQRDEGRELCEKGSGEGTAKKVIRGGDCGERDKDRGLRGKGRGERTV